MAPKKAKKRDGSKKKRRARSRRVHGSGGLLIEPIEYPTTQFHSCDSCEAGAYPTFVLGNAVQDVLSRASDAECAAVLTAIAIRLARRQENPDAAFAEFQQLLAVTWTRYNAFAKQVGDAVEGEVEGDEPPDEPEGKEEKQVH